MSADLLVELERTGALVGLDLPASVRDAERLRGHASGRRFYRLLDEDGRAQGGVLVVYPEGQEAEVDRYVDAASWFHAAGVRVPAVHDRGVRTLLVEDGGRVLLDRAARGPGATGRMYRQAVDAVCRIQARGRQQPGPNPDLALDRDRLHRELLFFEEHTVRGWLDVRDGTAEREALYERLVEAVSDLPTAECHRDYHSRNLLCDEGRLMVLDFQDVMRGPLLYDVASLVRDDYRDVPPGLVGELLHRFWGAAGRPLQPRADARLPARPRGLPTAARQAFCLVALQRSLKALGTFGYQVTVRGNAGYRRFAPRTRRHALRSLELLGWAPSSVGLGCLDDDGCG